MNHNLGNLEETILLIVMANKEESYGFSVALLYSELFKKTISISAVHSVLSRLETKGFIKSYMGGATEERGGRRKRIFEITQPGIRVVRQMREDRVKLWSEIPELKLAEK